MPSNSSDFFKNKTFFVWGMGLLGTSIALDIKKYGGKVSGCVLQQEELWTLEQLGFTDVFLAEDNNAIKNAIAKTNGILIATPSKAIIPIIKNLQQMDIPKDIWISDVASSKKDLMNSINAQEKFINFVGSHPMAGSDLSGPQNAYCDMFVNATVFLLRAENMLEKFPAQRQNYLQSVLAVKNFWAALGGVPFEVSYQTHDKWAAYLSHGLHLVSCMVPLLMNDIPEIYNLQHGPAGGSFRDISRVSGSNPQLWQNIILSNKKEVMHYLKRLSELSLEWHDALANDKLNIAEVFEQADAIRQKMVPKGGLPQ